MTTTNRVANRLVLLLAGLLLIALGGVAVLAWLPETAASTAELVTQGRDRLQEIVTSVGTTTVHAIALAVAVVLALLGLLVALDRGRGRVTTITDTEKATLPGVVEIGTGYLEAALADALGRRPELLALDLTAWRDGPRTSLLLRVQPRAGASPRAVVDAVHEAIEQLDTLLDRELPVLLHIAVGARTSLSHPDRVH